MSFYILGSIEPNDYQFSSLYKDIFNLIEKATEIEKNVLQFKQSTTESESSNYLKNELKKALENLNEKVKELEKNIKAFIALHEFRDERSDFPESYKMNRTNSKKNTADLAMFDPLIGKIPQGFEEEKNCLQQKLILVKQKLFVIETNLREDAPVDHTESLNNRINDILSLAKNNKKRIEDLDSKFKLNLTDTESSLKTNFKNDLESLRESILKMFKEVPKEQPKVEPPVYR